MRYPNLAVSTYLVLRTFGLALLSIALMSLPLSPAHSESRSINTSEDVNQIKKEYNRMKSEAALFRAYMAQVERVNATDFANEKAVQAQLERLDRFKPEDVAKGFISSLIVMATHNQQFRAGVKQKAQGKGANEFFDALRQDPTLIKQIPGASAAEQDIERFSRDIEVKIGAVKKKVGAKTRTQNGDSDIKGTQFALLDYHLNRTVDIISALFFIQKAEASITMATAATIFMILNIASVIIVVIGLTILIIGTIYYSLNDIYRFIRELEKAHSRYTDCYWAASRQGDYWAREFYRLGCWAAFIE